MAQEAGAGELGVNGNENINDSNRIEREGDDSKLVLVPLSARRVLCDE